MEVLNGFIAGRCIVYKIYNQFVLIISFIDIIIENDFNRIYEYNPFLVFYCEVYLIKVIFNTQSQ